MDTLLLNQAEHLRKSLSALEGEPGYWSLNRLLAEQIFSASLALAGISIELRSIGKACRALPTGMELDPNDEMTDKLLDMQRGLSAWHRQIDAARFPLLSGWQRAMVGFMAAGIRVLHGQIGELRNFILEADADAGGLSEDGPFMSVDDLLKSLDAHP